MSAIFMGKDYELAVYSKDDFIWDKQDLLVPAPSGVEPAAAAAASDAERSAVPRRARSRVSSSATARWARCSTRKGVFLNRCFDELNLTQPDLVADVHQAYVRAGADVIETNTFGANRLKLAQLRPGRPGCTRSTPQGARIARQAAREPGLGRRRRSARSASASSRGARPASTKRRRRSASRPQALADGGVDLFMLETFRDVERARRRDPRRPRASRDCRSSRR